MAQVHILIVEDEVLIHELLEGPLEDGGYVVTALPSGEAAMAELEKNHAEYQALMTDVNLGRNKLTGWDVAKRARELNPAIPVIYMTGDSAGEWAANGVPNSILLTKPFAPAQAVTAVSQLLNATPPPAPA
jgi:CheY-like chemotaxis protein